MAGCGKSSESDNTNVGNVIKMSNVDIPGAQTLFIAKSASTRANDGEYDEDYGEGGIPKLYKITATGQTYEVQFIDEKDKIIPVETEYFVNLLGEFILMRVNYKTYGYDENDQPVTYKVEMILIVDLDDGSVFNVDNNTPYAGPLHDILSTSQAMGGLVDFGFQKDKNGAIYFHTGVLNKIYKSGDNVMISQTALNLGDNGLWMMNRNGDIWFGYYCMKASGEFIDSDDKLDWHSYYVKDSHPGNFFRFDCHYDDEASGVDDPVYRMFIYKYTPGATKLERTVDLEHVTDYPVGPGLMPLTFIKNRMVIAWKRAAAWEKPGKIYVIDAQNNIAMYENDDKPFPRERTGGGWPNDRYRLSDSYIYDCAPDWQDRSDPDRNKIRRFDPADGSVTTIWEVPSSWDITSYMVSKGDAITITALEGATGNPVTAVREADGTVTEFKTYNEQTIYQLERLN